jgi:MFS-type transporter involved in bile tolerance (Atg22 family)
MSGLVDKGIVLYFAVLTYVNVAANISTASYDATLTDVSTPADLGIVPNLGRFSDGDMIIDVGSFVNELSHMFSRIFLIGDMRSALPQRSFAWNSPQT